MWEGSLEEVTQQSLEFVQSRVLLLAASFSLALQKGAAN